MINVVERVLWKIMESHTQRNENEIWTIYTSPDYIINGP